MGVILVFVVPSHTELCKGKACSHLGTLGLSAVSGCVWYGGNIREYLVNQQYPVSEHSPFQWLSDLL